MGLVHVNVRITGYASQVLGVIKEKYGLRDKGQALSKFAELFGGDFVEREVKDEVIRDMIRSSEAHIKKYGFKPMSDDELDRITGVK
jgi:hypothetical protein